MLLDNVNRKIRTGFISRNLRFKIYVDFAFIEVFCELYFIKYEIFCREVRKKIIVSIANLLKEMISISYVSLLLSLILLLLLIHRKLKLDKCAQYSIIRYWKHRNSS